MNTKIEMIKAKILFSSENEEEKIKALEIFQNILNNPESIFKNRLEALGFLIGNLLTEDQAYDKLLSILITEELDELQISTIIRKIKEIKKQEKLVNWVITELINNDSIHSNKRYIILKSTIENFLDKIELTLLEKATIDFFNIVLLLKEHLNFKEKVIETILQKMENTEKFEKLIYLNLLYTMDYKLEKTIEKMISKDIDNYFLLLIFSKYFKNQKLHDKIIKEFNNQNQNVTNILFNYFIHSLQQEIPYINSTININLNTDNMFYKIIIAILTKDKELIATITSEIQNQYKGIYLIIILRYLQKLGLININFKELEKSLSDIELEYLATEDAIIEINSSESKSTIIQEQKQITEENINQENINQENSSQENITLEVEENTNNQTISQNLIEDIEKIIKTHEDETNITDTIDITNTANITDTNFELLRKNFLSFLENSQELHKELILKAYHQNKNDFINIIEEFIFNDKYILEKTNKILKILDLLEEIDKPIFESIIKNLIHTLFINQNFETLNTIFRKFNLNNKLNFNNYFVKNEHIEWNENTENLLLNFIDYLHKNIYLTITQDELGKLCILIIENDTFSLDLKKKIGEKLEELY